MGDYKEVSAAVIKFTEFLKVKPKCNMQLIHKKNIGDYEGDNWIFFQEDHLSRYNKQYRSKIIIDSVPYPLNTESLNSDSNEDNTNVYNKLLEQNACYFFFKTGELEVSNSRESLQYTKKTIKAIQLRINEVLDDLHLIFTSKIVGHSTLYHATSYYVTKLRSIKSCLKPLHWEGVEISECYEVGNKNVEIESCLVGRRGGNNSYGMSIGKLHVNQYNCEMKAVFFLNDTGNKTTRRYITSYLNSHPDVEKTYVFNYTELSDFKMDLSLFKLINLSDVKLEIAKARVPREALNAFKYGMGDDRHRCNGFTRYFVPEEVPLQEETENYYLTLNNNTECTIGNTKISNYHSSELKNLYSSITNGLNIRYANIYLVKESSIKRLGTNWKSLENYCKEFVEQKSEELPLESLLNDFHEQGFLFNEQFGNLYFIIDKLKDDNIIKQYCDKSSIAFKTLERQENTLRIAKLFYGNSYKPHFELMIKEILDKYLLLRTFKSSFYFDKFVDSNREELKEGLLNYINSVDNKSPTIKTSRAFKLTMKDLLNLL